MYYGYALQQAVYVLVAISDSIVFGIVVAAVVLRKEDRERKKEKKNRVL